MSVFNNREGMANAYSALVGRIEAFSPCFHDKCVVDGDHKDFAGGFERGTVDVARDMSGTT